MFLYDLDLLGVIDGVVSKLGCRERTLQGPWLQVWRLAWAMISYKDVMENTSFEQDNNFANGIRQMRWIATWLRKARIKIGTSQAFVIQARFYNTHPSLDSLDIPVEKQGVDHNR
jgi:hypothetical protein